MHLIKWIFLGEKEKTPSEIYKSEKIVLSKYF